jgi:hypothetical protein
MRITGICLSLICVLLFAALSHAEIDPGAIVGAWLFDEGEGDTAKDFSGNGRDGSIVGDAKWVGGKFGTALEFNGTNVWVNVPEMEPLEQVTIAKWFYMTGRVGAWRCFFNHNGWSQGFTHYQFRPDNKMEFCIHSNANGGRHTGFEGSAFTADDSVLNEWHHLAVVYNSTESNIKVYFDGELDMESEWGALPASFGPGRIGSWDGGGREWQGMLDEVIIFNSLLEEDDITKLMNSGLKEALSVEPAGKLASTWGQIKNND